MSHVLDMYKYNWGLIFIHLMMIGQLVLAILHYKKHPPVSICMFIYLGVCFLFVVTPYSISYESSFGRFVFQFLQVLNVGVLTLVIFGWRDWPKTEETAYREPVTQYRAPGTQGESAPAMLPMDSAVRISSGFYWAFVSLWIVSVLTNIVSMIGTLSEEDDVRIGAAVVSLPFVIAMAVLGAIMLYRAWLIIQDGQARTTPGKAVGFCFIPFFNFYWIFVGFGGLAKDINAFARRYNLTGVRLPEELFTVQCVLILVNVVLQYIPVLGNIYGIAIGAIGLYLFRQIYLAVNAISDQGGARTTAPAQNTPAAQI